MMDIGKNSRAAGLLRQLLAVALTSDLLRHFLYSCAFREPREPKSTNRYSQYPHCLNSNLTLCNRLEVDDLFGFLSLGMMPRLWLVFVWQYVLFSILLLLIFVL